MNSLARVSKTLRLYLKCKKVKPDPIPLIKDLITLHQTKISTLWVSRSHMQENNKSCEIILISTLHHNPRINKIFLYNYHGDANILCFAINFTADKERLIHTSIVYSVDVQSTRMPTLRCPAKIIVKSNNLEIIRMSITKYSSCRIKVKPIWEELNNPIPLLIFLYRNREHFSDDARCFHDITSLDMIKKITSHLNATEVRHLKELKELLNYMRNKNWFRSIIESPDFTEEYDYIDMETAIIYKIIDSAN